MEPKPFYGRVLLAKSFIDSHDRPLDTIARLLRDAGMEVILLDYQVPEEIVATALQEDVDVIGVSFMSGGQVEVTRALITSLAAAGLSWIPVVVGGAIRPFDTPDLEAAGVRTIFRGGETLESIQQTFADLATASRADPSR
jgi:methylmalonyl-CoA mutase C-terminal domain/subunit